MCCIDLCLLTVAEIDFCNEAATHIGPITHAYQQTHIFLLSLVRNATAERTTVYSTQTKNNSNSHFALMGSRDEQKNLRA